MPEFLIANPFTYSENYCQMENYCCVQTDGSVFHCSSEYMCTYIQIRMPAFICIQLIALEEFIHIFIALLFLFFFFILSCKKFYVSWPVSPTSGSIDTEREREKEKGSTADFHLGTYTEEDFNWLACNCFLVIFSMLLLARWWKKLQIVVMNILK